MITLENVSKTYTISKGSPVHAVRGVSLHVNKGEFVVITGRSGSGKTTVLNLAAGMTAPTSGRVLFEGTDLWSLSDNQQSALRNKRIGFIFQFPSLHPSLNVLENVTLPTIFDGKYKENVGRARAEALLGQVGLSDKLSSYPRQLSAGQQQRVVVARALMLEPSLILADEPTSDLDEATELEMMELLRSIYQTTHATVLLVTHNPGLAVYGTRSVTMAEGAIRSDSAN